MILAAVSLLQALLFLQEVARSWQRRRRSEGGSQTRERKQNDWKMYRNDDSVSLVGGHNCGCRVRCASWSEVLGWQMLRADLLRL
mmetsp:Transcript_30476/g.96927  ORF Transcript_30476/g.96927 Transcript_30476/m.96927 type:complete len:85 (-) Transcript_30476:100-354(-)